jgi:hypothetical protein
MAEVPPIVFVSYSHDSPEHQDQVLRLSNKLRSEGIDAILDQYEESPPEGWPRWLEKGIESADFVIVVCTETYSRRVLGKEPEGVGNGVKWEGGLIYQYLYSAGASNQKFIPVVFGQEARKHVPTPLQGATSYDVSTAADYETLYWRLRGRPKSKPELGPLKEMPFKERRTLFITGFIDLELWSKTEWKGIGFVHDRANREPPGLVLLFTDEETAVSIFKGWAKRLGEYDTDDELRISIVEGDVEGEGFGYFVHIGTNIQNVRLHVKRTHPDLDTEHMVVVSRINRMNPGRGSENLNFSKQRFRLFGSYSLLPGVMHDDGRVAIVDGIRILKKSIEFREYSDIQTKDDPDSVLNKRFRTEPS